MKFGYILSACVLAASLTACGTRPPPMTTSNAVSRMIGKPIDAAIDALGYPTSEREIVGHRVVLWEINDQVGTAAAYDEIQRTKYTRNVVKRCKIEFEIGGDMKIVRGRNEGNEYDCAEYRVALYKKLRAKS